MIRLLVPGPLAPDAAFPLEDGQARYLTQVMRRGAGDEVLAFNGRDGEWLCVLAEAGKRGVILRAVRKTREQSVGPDLVLVVALVKRNRLETIIEKAAELGASAVWPVVTERTNQDHVREDRLRAIAAEASEQTGRLDAPEIRAPEKLDRLIAGWDPARRLLICDEAGDARPVLDVLREAPQGPWAVLIGPEGGFSPAERERLRALDYAVPATLGPRILRADTAAISALTLWQAALGDWRA